jgi:hypothetical protein
VYDTACPYYIQRFERKNDMKPIAKEYVLLFNAVTDAEEVLSQLRRSLIDIQKQAEDLFLEEQDPN